jgi:transposase-like protein
MKNDRSRYYGHRFPPEIISYTVWVCHRFCLSFRDVEDLSPNAESSFSYETIRLWCQKFGPDYARQLKRRQGRLGDIWHLDEVLIRINSQQQYLWLRHRVPGCTLSSNAAPMAFAESGENQRSISRSLEGCEQQVSRLPSAGGSSGSG